MHILKWELRSHLKSLLIWCAIFVVIIFMMTSEFSAYYNNPDMADVLSAMPEAMLKAFSMENANLTTTTGYLSLVSLYFYIMVGVFAVLLGSNIISKEERDKTAEYLMTMPVSREKIITSKLLAGFINCVILTGVIALATIAAMQPYHLDKPFFDFLWLLSLAFFFTMMIFLSVGAFLASVLKRYKSSGMISASLLMFLYFLNIIVALSKNLDFLKYITPFKYFEASVLLKNGVFELKYLIITAVIVLVGIIGTYIVYPRRDLRI
ncbi:ABC transporter permease subunit [Fusibacter bizertensis]